MAISRTILSISIAFSLLLIPQLSLAKSKNEALLNLYEVESYPLIISTDANQDSENHTSLNDTYKYFYNRHHYVSTTSECLPHDIAMFEDVFFMQTKRIEPCMYDGRVRITRVGMNGDSYSFADQSGKRIVGWFNRADNFSEGLASVHPHKGKSGFINPEGNTAIDFIYDDAQPFHNGLAGIKLDDKWGFINKDGKMVIENKYDQVSNFYNGRARVTYITESNARKYGYIDIQGKLIIPTIYDEASDFRQQFTSVRKGTQWGVIDTNGKLILPIEFEDTITGNAPYISAKKDGKYGVYDHNGKQLIKHKYDYVIGLSDNLAITATLDTTKPDTFTVGAVDYSDNIIIPFEYEYIHGFVNNNVAIAVKDEKIGFVNRNNETILPFIYDEFFIVNNGDIIIRKGNKIGVVDQHGALVIPVEYDSLIPFQKGLSRVSKNNTYGYINRENKVVIDIDKDFIGLFDYSIYQHGITQFIEDNKIGIIDSKGHILIPAIYDSIDTFKDGKAKVSLNDKEGYIDFKGNILIPIKYERLSEFVVGYPHIHAIQKDINGDKKEGIISHDNQVIIPTIYYDVYPISDTIFTVNYSSKINDEYVSYHQFIDYQGNPVTPKYERMERVDVLNDLVEVGMNDKFGYIDKTGKVVIPLEYDTIYYGLTTENPNKLGIATVNGKYGMINQQNEVLLPFEYDSICDKYSDSYLNPVYNAKDLEDKEFDENNYIRICNMLKNGKHGLVNQSTAEIILPLTYDTIKKFEDNGDYAIVTNDNKQGIINHHGEVLVPLAYDDISSLSYHDDKAVVTIDNKQGVINIEEHKSIIPMNYQNIRSETKNLLKVEHNGKFGILNYDNELIIPYAYDKIEEVLYQDLLIVKSDGKYGIVDHHNNITLPIDYDEISDSRVYLKVKKDGKYGAVKDKTGKLVVPATYDEIEIYDERITTVIDGETVTLIGDE